jgi:hypothetical protein
MRTIVTFAIALSFSALLVGCNKAETEATPTATCTERPDKIPVQTAKGFCLTKYKEVDLACQQDPVYQYLQREAICQTPDGDTTVETCCHSAGHRYLVATDQVRFDPAEHLRKYKENELKKKAASE